MIKIMTDKKFRSIIEEELYKREKERWQDERMCRLESRMSELELQIEILKGSHNGNCGEKPVPPKML